MTSGYHHGRLITIWSVRAYRICRLGYHVKMCLKFVIINFTHVRKEKFLQRIPPNVEILIDFSLTVKPATLLCKSARGSAILSA